jgi:hypothetical protein
MVPCKVFCLQKTSYCVNTARNIGERGLKNNDVFRKVRKGIWHMILVAVMWGWIAFSNPRENKQNASADVYKAQTETVLLLLRSEFMKANPSKYHKGVKGSTNRSILFSLSSALDEVIGQRHVPAALHQEKVPGTLCTGIWVGPWAGLDGCGKTPSHRNLKTEPTNT